MTSKCGWAAVFSLFVVAVLAACGEGGTAESAAAISSQPTDQSVVVGTTATFTVVASNATGYQWQRSTDGGTTFTDVSGATAASHTTPVATLADSGTRYRVFVSGVNNSVTSSAVTLTVTSVADAPAITVQPAYASVTAPAIANFSVTATGTNLNYQWQQCQDSNEICASWNDLSGAITATYSTGPTDVSMTGQRFRVIVSNTEGSLDSAVVSLNVDPTPVAPVITGQPVDAAVVAPATASFTVAFTSVPTVLPNWQYSNNGSDWFNLGVFDNTYTTAPTSIGDNGRQFRAILENAAGSVTTSVVTLTVTTAASAPSFTTQPANVTVTAGQNAQFTVAVSGTPTPTLQWQLSTDEGVTWSNITGATGTVFDVLNATLANSAQRFRAVASNSEGNVNSNAAVLAVIPVFVPTFQFNLFAFNSGPYASDLYGGSVKDDAGTIQCSGYTRLDDPCPKWRADFPSGTSLNLKATPWPGWRVSRWIGGDCGSPGTADTVTLTIDHNSNCRPEFEVIPGSTFSISAVAAGAWVGLVVEVVADRYGNLVVPDTPRISCGPLASAQICEATVEIGASPYIVLRLRAHPLSEAPVGNLRWSCTSVSPEDTNTVVEQTAAGADIAIGPIYGNTACSAELIPTL